MTPLEAAYRSFIDCHNERRWEDLGLLLHSQFTKNNQHCTSRSYTARVQTAGNLEFEIIVLTVDENSQTLASTVLVRWKPSGQVMGIEPLRKNITFVEKHLTWYTHSKLLQIIDISDRESIYRQLSDLEPVYRPDFDITAWSRDEATGSPLSRDDLEGMYKAYIGCINGRTTQANLDTFYHTRFIHNGSSTTVDALDAGMRDVASAIPDLVFDIVTMVIDKKAQRVAVRLELTGTPVRSLAGIQATGGKGRWSEHATYQFRHGKIALAWAIGTWGFSLQGVTEPARNADLW